MLRSSERGVGKLEESHLGFTLKAFIVGILSSAFMGIGIPYADMIIQGSRMTTTYHFPVGALFVFFILVVILNVILGLINRNLTLTYPELLTAYIMMTITYAVLNTVQHMLPMMTGVYYYATPENNWAELIHPYVPNWMTPQSLEGIKNFYEGMFKNPTVPWGIWIKPLIAWGSFLIAMYFVMICMLVILRKQWIENEKLIYPLVQLPLEMAKDDGNPSLLRPFFRNPVMWLGFLIPFVIGSVRALHSYYHFIPTIELGNYSIYIFRRSTHFPITLSLAGLGFFYFVNLDISLSLWLFNFLSKIQRAIFNITGISPSYGSQEVSRYSSRGSAILAHVGMGAMVVLVLYGLWVARDHLKDVLGKAFGKTSDVDDSNEIISYRKAVWGMIGGLIFMGAWLWLADMPAWVIPILFFAAFVSFIGVSRIVAEAGVAACVAPLIPAEFVVTGFGSSVLGSVGLVSLGFSYIWVFESNVMMPYCANALKLGEGIRRKKPLFWAMSLTLVVAIVSSCWMIFKLTYTYGGINLSRHFDDWATIPFRLFVDRRMMSPSDVYWLGWLCTGIGGTIMALLMLARRYLLWWPLHPVGFPISAIWASDYLFFTVFLAWLIKAVVLKYGGPKAYRGTRPFFLGLILGQLVCAGTWTIIDSITGMTGNFIYFV